MQTIQYPIVAGVIIRCAAPWCGTKFEWEVTSGETVADAMAIAPIHCETCEKEFGA